MGISVPLHDQRDTITLSAPMFKGSLSNLRHLNVAIDTQEPTGATIAVLETIKANLLPHCNTWEFYQTKPDIKMNATLWRVVCEALAYQHDRGILQRLIFHNVTSKDPLTWSPVNS